MANLKSTFETTCRSVKDILEIQIGDCPKCGRRTFVVYAHKKMGKTSLAKPKGSTLEENHIKGQCYNCSWVQEFNY